MKAISISEALTRYLDVIHNMHGRPTMLAYRNAVHVFQDVLAKEQLPPDSSPIETLTEDAIVALATKLKTYAPATEQLYMQAVKGFYAFVDSECLADINMSRVQTLMHQRVHRRGQRSPRFTTEDIERLLKQLENVDRLIISIDGEEPVNFVLRAYRDRAFLLTLADTGLRVHEACKLRRGDVDWDEHRAVVIGKGGRQAFVRFTSRAIQSIKEYLSHRASFDRGTGNLMASLPLFARHDKGAGKKVKPMTTTTGRNIVKERVAQLLGNEMVGRITPHSFRHYFVTTVLRNSGNLKLAQELARHANIQVTQRYTYLSDDELDKGYHEIFENKDLKR